MRTPLISLTCLLLLFMAQGAVSTAQAASVRWPCLPANYQPTSADLVNLAALAADRNGLNRELLFRLVKVESSWNPCAVSPKFARGLTQLMPATAARFGVRNAHDPAQALEGGARYLRWLLDFFDGDVNLALAGYNAGEGAVLKYGRRVPPYNETRQYVAKINGMSYARPNQYLSPVALTARVRPSYVAPAALIKSATPQIGVTTEAATVPVKDEYVETKSAYFWNRKPE